MLQGEGEEFGAGDGFEPVEHVRRDARGFGRVAERAESVATVPGVDLDFAGVDVSDEPGVRPARAEGGKGLTVPERVEILKSLEGGLVGFGVKGF